LAAPEHWWLTTFISRHNFGGCFIAGRLENPAYPGKPPNRFDCTCNELRESRLHDAQTEFSGFTAGDNRRPKSPVGGSVRVVEIEERLDLDDRQTANKLEGKHRRASPNRCLG
jgi:hypothetical protein